ncbi:DUF3977 family protein [Streptococcus caprae]|uniref:DUF3977 family protein n=1 Tax=Streptococcus caprae TaxID=1640501 RepID=A0ABV8CVI2_9STRE
MTKYFEIGFGNRWFMRTEFETSDGTEYEVKGWVRPIAPQSIYLRLWVGYCVFIWDSEDGIKCGKKSRKALKFILGIRSKSSQ